MGEGRKINWRKVRQDARYDGKFVLRSITELSPAEIRVTYKELWRVELAFRELKTGLEITPVYHWASARVRGTLASVFWRWLRNLPWQDCSGGRSHK